MNGKRTGLLLLGILAWAILCVPGYEDVVSYVWKAASRPVVVVDAGHGGIDGGAEGAGGVAEQDINLHIALFLKEELEDHDVLVVMTREDRNGLYDLDQAGAIRTLKTMDMHERKRIIEEADPDLTVSVHLNSFTQDASVRGAQVFYPASGGDAAQRSETAAVIIQEAFNETVNGAAPRTEQGKDDVFLLRDVTSPIIIAECGFLSNPEDLERLKTEKYQKEMASVMADGVCRFLEKEADNTEKTEEKYNKR